MPGIPIPYVVRTCDHIEGIAQRFGVSADDIRQEPKNADVVKQRGDDLAMLVSGDVLFVTPADPGSTPLDTGATNNFAAPAGTVDVYINLIDGNGPLAGAAYSVEGVDTPLPGTADGNGQVKLTVPATLRSVQLTLTDLAQPLDVRIGGLDPVDETTGVQMRLAHLGFFQAAIDGEDDDYLRFAVQSFQTSKGLDATGEVDDALRSQLATAHGS